MDPLPFVEPYYKTSSLANRSSPSLVITDEADEFRGWTAIVFVAYARQPIELKIAMSLDVWTKESYSYLIITPLFIFLLNTSFCLTRPLHVNVMYSLANQ